MPRRPLKSVSQPIDSPNYMSLEGYIAYLQGLVTPEMQSPTIDVEVYDDYGSPRASFSLSYRRPYTDEEWTIEQESLKAQRERQLEHERALYERLKGKFEGEPYKGGPDHS